MKITSFTIISLLALVSGAPASEDDGESIIISKDIYPKEAIKYSGNHEIVKIILPLNSINFDDVETAAKKPNEDKNDKKFKIFFVEADTDSDGKRVDRGLYVFKEGKATKILEHGRDAAASSDDSKTAFFAAKDGIYIYNQDKNSAEKYGTIDDSIIGIAKEKTGDVIYILTEDFEVYKVSSDGRKKEKIDEIIGAKQIVLDYSNNIYFYSDDKKAYVRTDYGVKKIEGLPEKPSKIDIIKSPFVIDNAVIAIIDNKVYFIFNDGSSLYTGLEIESDAIPSAFAPEGGLIQYYAHDKKIYEFNIWEIFFGDVENVLKAVPMNYFENIREVVKKRMHF